MRLTWFFIVLSVTVLLAACGGGKPENGPDATPTASQQATTTTVAPTSTTVSSARGEVQQRAGTTGTVIDRAIRLPKHELDGIRYGGTLRWADAYSSGNLDPKYNNQNTVTLTGKVLEALIIWDPNENDNLNHIAPNLAETWTISPDLKTYTFSLRKGVRWQNISPVNGRELVADDVEFSLRRYMESDSTWAGAYSQVESVTAKDKYTVVVNLSTPSAWAINDLFPNVQWVIAKETIKTEREGIGVTLIGTGPYILSDYTFRRGATFVRNPDYWKKDAKGNTLPYVDRIENTYMTDPATAMAAYRTGQIDTDGVINNLDDRINLSNTVQGMRLYWVRVSNGFGMAFNTKNKPWDDVNLRRAFNMAIDKTSYINPQTPIPGLYETGGPLPWALVSEKQFTADDLGPYYKYDPAESKKLRIAAGFADGKVKVATPITYGTGKSSILGTEVLQQLWKKEGIEVEIARADIAISRDVYYARSWKDIGNTFQNTGDYSLNWFAQNKFKCDAFQNSSWICDPETQKIVDTIRVTTDAAKLKQQARLLWDIDALGVYNIWLPTTPNLSTTGPRVRNHVSRQSFNNQVTFEWLTDGPRTTP